MSGPMRQKDRILLALTLGALLAIPLLAFAGWYFPSVGLRHIHPLLSWLAGIVLGGTALLICVICVLLALTLLSGRDCFLFAPLRRLVMKWLLPGLLGLGTLLRIEPDRLRRAFIELNNRLVESATTPLPAERILILLPHCLQRSECPVKVTDNPELCQRCGACTIMPLVDLARRFRVELAVVTGGTLAREVLHRKRPALVIAVACERDLASGIRDAWPLPVFGVLNERPEGPCVNTTVDVAAVERLLANRSLIT